MLTIHGPRPRLCSGPGRREFLRAGSLGFLGLGLPDLLRARASAGSKPGPARNCILLFLTGGPPQQDTWDPKPDAPAEVRGEFAAIPTAVPGVRFAEHFPLLAARADKLCVVRSVTHPDRVHTSAVYTALTGLPHPRANQDGPQPGPDTTDHPHVGSLVALARSGAGGVPPFVALPEVLKEAGVHPVPGLGPGFLGTRYAPFQLLADAGRAGLRVPDVVLPADVPADRLLGREGLLGRLDRAAGRVEAAGGMDVWQRKALDAVRAGGLGQALDLDREDPRTRDRYGRHLFGQGCLMARRLAEAGVGLTTVYWHYEGPDDSPVWDTHENNFKHLRGRLMPPTDRAVSALLDDLADRGMLDETLVVVMGEFGRTPKVNPKAGRDHWGRAQSVVFAGAGVRAGTVYGATVRDGGEPADKPVGPADVTATILHLLGVPPDLEVTDRTGRPIRACTGTPIAGVLA
ncbi:MAG: DUF1501 domain-containing protein [Gemmataceae bacterium]|nr:DUF1501 domain-containing protein [Gemmataceae bacterium]